MKNIKDRFQKFFEVISPFKFQALILFIVTFLAVISETLSLSLIMPLLSMVMTEKTSGVASKFLLPLFNLWPNVNQLMITMVLFTFFISCKSALTIYQAYLRSNFVWMLNEHWNNIIMTKYINSSFTYFVNQKQGVLMHNLLDEPATAAQSLLHLIMFLTKFLLSLFLFLVLILTNWKITLALIVLGGIVILPLMNTTRKYCSDKGVIKIKLLQWLSVHITESILGFVMLKAFSLENLRLNYFRQINKKIRKLRIEMDVVRAIPEPIGEFFISILFVFLIALMLSIGKMDIRVLIPTLGLFVIVAQRLLLSISYLFANRMAIYFTLPSVNLVYNLITQDIEQEDVETGSDFEGVFDNVQFKDVEFGYISNKPLFKNLNLTILKGRMVAIIGPSGIGKSTIIGLLIGLIRPNRGEILVNGRILNDFNLKSWRSRLGYVSQDTIIFNASIKENIRMCKIDASNEEIMIAAKGAAIHDFIISLPANYDTEVGDRGMKLSGGQKQRIAIARAILRDPEIYIFDEATSSLDRESERLIQQSIEGLMKTKTIIIISHHKSTFENADVVYDLTKI